MNKNFLFLALGCALLLTGCVKDEPNQTFLKLVAEGYNPDPSAKAAVLDEKTYWVNGENVWINNYVYDVHVSSSNQAEVRNIYDNPDHIYRAVYPASVLKSISGDDFTITVPKSHWYMESGGKQVIDELPMAAYFSGSEDPEDLQFKHLTAAITVQIKNTRSNSSDTLELGSIELSNSAYRLSGDVVVDIRNAASSGTTLSITPQKRVGGDTVSMFFYTHDRAKKVAPGSTVDIQIPITPVGGSEGGGVASTFTIKVVGRIKGSRYIFEKTTNSRDNTILRAQLGYAVTKFEEQSEASDLFDVKETQTFTVGTETVTRDFYEINTPAELITLAEALDSNWNTSANDGTKYRTGNYILKNDLDMEGATIVPIHYYNEAGSNMVYFYGNNKTIKNFVVNSSIDFEPNCCGLFGRTAGDSIAVVDLNIENGTYDFSHAEQFLIDGDQNYTSAVGGIFSYVDKKGILIQNCHVNNVEMGAMGAISAGNKDQVDFYVGGIVGLVTEGCTIRNCSVRNVRIDNNNDGSEKLVDQFGGAIGRIDTRNKEKFIYIEDFKYIQGDTAMTFVSGLKNIRYGGLIANITGSKGVKIYVNNDTMSHNVVFLGKPEKNLYAAGFLGSQRGYQENYFYISGDCVINGTIDNQALDGYDGSFEINKYVSCAGSIGVNKKIDGTLETCNNTLAVISSNNKKTGFRYPNQTFFKNT